MLLSFSIRNFRSFRDEQTLNLVAQRRFAEHQDRLISLPGVDVKVLPAAVFYGANGAGKSNLIRGFEFAVDLIKGGVPPNAPIPLQPFKLAGRTESTSSFELRFFVAGRIFGYGFEADAKQVCSEWLDVFEGETAKPLFERKANGAVSLEFSEQLKIDSPRVAALKEVGIRSNQLVLSAIRESVETESQGQLIQSVFSWLSSVFVARPETHYDPIGFWLAHHSALQTLMNDYMREAGTGLHQVTPDPIPAEHLISEANREEAKTKLRSKRQGLVQVMLKNGKDAYVDLDKEGRLVTYDLACEHKGEAGEPIVLPMSEQSDGTQRLAELLVLLHIGHLGGVILIDEIDRSLHPLLSRKFLESFLKSAKSSQLLVTTHDTHLLDLSLLRRDEIWFTEKDRGNATHIYPLADFPVRNDLRADRGYLQGRFGAIPFLGGVDRIVDRESHDSAETNAATSQTTEATRT